MNRPEGKNRIFLLRALAVLIALGVWQAASAAVGMEILLSSPVSVFRRLAAILSSGASWAVIGRSLARIALGFGLAFVSGTLLAALAARFPAAETLIWPYVTVMKSVPVAAFIIIALIWFKASALSVFISFLMVFPVIYSNTLQGIKSADRKLVEAARVFRMPLLRRAVYVYTPAVRPYLLSACSVALGMSWKSGVAAEVIGVVRGSIGEKLYESKIYLEMSSLLAWTVIILIASFIFEKIVLMLLKKLFEAAERL